MSLRSGACHPRTQVGDLMVTGPDGSATLKIPDRTSCIEYTRSCVAAVLAVRGENCNGTWRVSSIQCSACILAVKSRPKPYYGGELDKQDDR